MGANDTTTSLAERAGRVLVVGAGSMGQAICAALVGPCGVKAANVCVADPGAEKRAAVEARYGVRTVRSAVDGLAADTIILAVKPNVVLQVCSELAAAGVNGSRVISIAAGVSVARLQDALGSGVQIVRVMPNTPLAAGAGVAGVCAPKSTDAEALALACDLFSSCGLSVVVDEAQMDVVTALSGSGPAYFEQIAHAMALTGERLGLPYEKSLELVLGTMHGTAAMLMQTGQPLPEAIEAVSSPGGTTVAGLRAMDEHGLKAAVERGVCAAAARSRELGT